MQALKASLTMLYMNCAELLSETVGVRQAVGDDDTVMAQLVDGLVLLYHMSAHKQLGKVWVWVGVGDSYNFILNM